MKTLTAFSLVVLAVWFGVARADYQVIIDGWLGIDEIVLASIWGYPARQTDIIVVSPEVKVYLYRSADLAKRKRTGCVVSFTLTKGIVTKAQYNGQHCPRIYVPDYKHYLAERKTAKKTGIAYVKILTCAANPLSSRKTLVGKASASKIAIFPLNSDSPCLGQNRPREEKIASTLRTIIQNNDSLRLAYFYYDKSPGDPLRNNTHQLWIGSVPFNSLVYRFGQELDVDAVLTSWRPSTGAGYCTDRKPPYPIKFYLLDLKSQCMLSAEGDEAHLKEMTEQLFADFLGEEEMVKLKEEKARRKAAKIAAKIAAIVYVIRCEGCTSTTPNPQRAPVTKIAIFPFGSDSECLGESRPTQEHMASTLRTIIQHNNSLKLTYFYYDEASGDPLRNNTDKLWVGGVSRRPYAESIYRLGQERDVDAVLVAWRPSGGSTGYRCTDEMPPFPIKLYLIDVKSQYMLSVEGNEARLEGMTEQFFAHFLKGPANRSAAANKR